MNSSLMYSHMVLLTLKKRGWSNSLYLWSHMTSLELLNYFHAPYTLLCV
jgi:hypothetical protein